MCLLFGLFLLGAIVAIAALSSSSGLSDLRRRASAAFASASGKGDRAEEILRERLARGEIGTEEYERAARLLRDHDEG